MKILLLLLALFRPPEIGIATNLGCGWNGRRGASGIIYNCREPQAAHKSIAFGTWVHVTALDTGASVNVMIVDRGPFGRGRVIDLQRDAFRAIAGRHRGGVKVRVEILDDSKACGGYRCLAR
jgi:rare lipoprotein A